MRTSHVATAALVVGLASCIITDDSSLTIRNRSARIIDEVHLAAVNDRDWGPDLLRGALAPGDSLVIDHIDCGHYDVLVVDGLTVGCVLPDVHLCFADATWTITDSTFATCTVP